MPNKRRGSAAERKRLRNSLRLRDGDNCCWCGEPMVFFGDAGWTQDGPYIATFEHLQPVRCGGTFGAYNLKLAHRVCNHERDVDPKTVEQMSQYTERATA